MGLQISEFLHFHSTDLSRFTGGFATRALWRKFSNSFARAMRVDRSRGSCQRILRILSPWYRSNCISTQNRPRLCLPTQARISLSPIRVPVAGWWRVIIPVGSPRYPMRMWVRPPCDLSVPGEHNTWKGPGRKRRVAMGVSKKHLGLFVRTLTSAYRIKFKITRMQRIGRRFSRHWCEQIWQVRRNVEIS